MITIPLYYQATCNALTGTWQGFMVNPTDLVPSKKSVTIQLIAKNNRIIGKYNNQYLYAVCNKGQLSKIFTGPKKCGRFSNLGGLVANNALVLQVNEQNAMMDWNLLFFLQRVSDNTNFKLPQNITIDAVQTCH